jgi:hypothetical protein
MTMRRHCSLGSLKGITLSPEQEVHNDSPPDHILHPNTLRLLFAFPNLEVLNISTIISFSEVDNTLIEDMASAWPHLKSLELRYFFASRRTTRVTIDGLLPLASCSSLRALAFNLDPTIRDTSIPLRPGVRNEALFYLGVGHSPITDPCAVASFLSEVFPCLTNIDAWEGYWVGEYDDPGILEVTSRWAHAKNLYRHFVGIRS